MPSKQEPARIARAVAPTVARFAAEKVVLALETEPASFGAGHSGGNSASEGPAQLTLKEVAAAIRRRKLSSVELTRSLLERIALATGAQRLRSRRSRGRAGGRQGGRPYAARAAGRRPAARVPLAHKDMYYSAGKPAGCGSKVRERLDRAGNVDRDRPAGGRRVVSPRAAAHVRVRL